MKILYHYKNNAHCCFKIEEHFVDNRITLKLKFSMCLNWANIYCFKMENNFAGNPILPYMACLCAYIGHKFTD